MEQKPQPIKESLISRFVIAKGAIESSGDSWRVKLTSTNPFYNTYEGSKLMDRASSAITDPGRIGVDNINKIVLDLEKLTEPNEQPA